VVIHQPSSDIFKMFDRLLILDTGGYLIYNGNPIDSIEYFKSKVQAADWNESECPTCGNVNPEQVFNIVETNVLDEFGQLTHTRKISPQEWSEHFRQQYKEAKKVSAGKEDLPEISFKIPGKLKQFGVFIKRDILKKLNDTQYLVINFGEAPLLAFILAFIVRYFDLDVSNQFGYTLEGNMNLPVYIFMSVIVGIFMGLTVSAEEIIKDRKILKREARNNSWLFKIEIDEALSRYIIEKGSVAVDGISLTINACENAFFEVNIIPHTGAQTTLLGKNVGEPVNVETDLIGKYVKKLLFAQSSEQKAGKSSGVTLETLLKYGFGK